MREISSARYGRIQVSDDTLAVVARCYEQFDEDGHQAILEENVDPDTTFLLGSATEGLAVYYRSPFADDVLIDDTPEDEVATKIWWRARVCR